MTGEPSTPRLRDYEWDVSYSHEDGDLVELFFVPSLARATLYRRATGYFSGDVLAMAARGLDRLIGAGGRMELLVGCTLNAEDIEQIEKGYGVREHAERAWIKKLTPSADDAWAREKIGYLAWMIAHELLDVKLAIPLDEHGRMREGLGLYHAKMGIVEDAAGDRLAFSGSINETPAGWYRNCESFSVSCSWRDGTDAKRVAKGLAEFQTLWEGKAHSARVVEFPEALKEKLLEYMPQDDTFQKPRRLPPAEPGVDWSSDDSGAVADFEAQQDAAGALTPDERRRLVWTILKHGPKHPVHGPATSVATSVVAPWPHQIQAFSRMVEGWPFRLLIADEVGLGKTIEAGLIIRHAWVAELAKRILILAPKAVLTQWQAELYEKFNLVVPIYTGHSLVWPRVHPEEHAREEAVSREAWVKQPLVIASSHLMRRAERQPELVNAEDWDLLIMDEAHHARRKAPGTPREGGPNRLLTLLQKLQHKARSLLLMTATPMQVHPIELWDLLKLLGLPEAWLAREFVDYFEAVAGNPSEERLFWAAKLFQASEAEFGEIPADLVDGLAGRLSMKPLAAKKVLKALREPSSMIPIKQLDVGQRRLALAILRHGSPVMHRMSRHTRSLLRDYYKRGLISSPIADREPIDLEVELSPAERSLYEAVEDYISDTYKAATPDKKTAVGFVMTIYRRRLASSFAALRSTLNARLARMEGHGGEESELRLLEDASQDEAADDVESVEEVSDQERAALDAEEELSIKGILAGIAKLGTDSKALELVKHLNESLGKGYDSAIVFTQYTDTMDFLREFLANRMDLPIGCFSGRGGEYRSASGAWTSCGKDRIKQMLKEGRIRLLICTDAASEGLNLQTCGLLVNYDLPWNPMKVEQRIGRVDRIGQRYPKVRVINLAYADTVEADIYFAIGKRINLFHGVVGKLQPILSQLPKRFETAVLQSRDTRDQARQRAVQEVDGMIKATGEAAFDIDDVGELLQRIPELPAPLYTPSEVEHILADESLLPVGVASRHLDPGTFALKVPGVDGETRATADVEFFDLHSESSQLALPDGPLFAALARRVLGEHSVAPEPLPSLSGFLNTPSA